MLKFSHANREGTGSQLICGLVPAADGEDGYMTISILNQSGPKQKGRRAAFDERDAVSYDLRASELGHIITVLGGRRNSLLGGRGLARTFDTDNFRKLFVDRCTEPFLGFSVHIVDMAEGRKRDGRIYINETEAVSLLKTVEASMDRVAFGD